MVIMLSSCSLLKDRTVEKTRIREIEKSSRLAPGAQLSYFPPTYSYPLPNPQKPNLGPFKKSKSNQFIKKDTLIKGDNGSEMWVFFNKDGSYKGSICNCPAIEEESESDKRIKEKQAESKLNTETINTVGKWVAIILIPGQFFFALAFCLRRK